MNKLIFIIPPLLIYLLIISFGIKLGFEIFYIITFFFLGLIIFSVDFELPNKIKYFIKDELKTTYFFFYLIFVFLFTGLLIKNEVIEKRNIIIKEKHIIYKGISVHIRENCYNDFYTIYVIRNSIFNKNLDEIEIKCFKKEIK